MAARAARLIGNVRAIAALRWRSILPHKAKPAVARRWMAWLVLLLLVGLAGCEAPHDPEVPYDQNATSCLRGVGIHGETLARVCTVVIQSATPVDRAKAFSNRGIANLEASHFEQAIHLGQAIRLNPDTEGSFLWRCEAYLGIGKPDLAISDCDEALRRSPGWDPVFDARGKAYAAKGQYKRAIQDFDEAIRIGPIYREWYQDRGRAYQALGQTAKAASDFAKAESLPPVISTD